MTELTQQIVDLEWEMFDQVHNIGGRASCQEDKVTFFLMRSSQFEAWSIEMRRSYLDDLYLARAEGRNPIAEKYGYMMEYTDPAGYAQIQSILPPRSPEKQELITNICTLHAAWNHDLHQRFPHLAGRGRALDRAADSIHSTSFDTYLAGELATYSTETLSLYWSHIQQLKNNGENMNEQILKNTTEQYGYPSLEAAEASLTHT